MFHFAEPLLLWCLSLLVLVSSFFSFQVLTGLVSTYWRDRLFCNWTFWLVRQTFTINSWNLGWNALQIPLGNIVHPCCDLTISIISWLSVEHVCLNVRVDAFSVVCIPRIVSSVGYFKPPNGEHNYFRNLNDNNSLKPLSFNSKNFKLLDTVLPIVWMHYKYLNNRDSQNCRFQNPSDHCWNHAFS